MNDLPVQPSLRRMKAFGVRPKRDLGQNFLIDSNILDVIARAADLQRDDVVLEVGGGLGVLSEHLAERVRHVHVVEATERLLPVCGKDHSVARALQDLGRDLLVDAAVGSHEDDQSAARCRGTARDGCLGARRQHVPASGQ